MEQIITDLSSLTIAEPFKFLNEHCVDAEASQEVTEVVNKLKEVINDSFDVVALSAPQIGINKKVFCIKFNDVIKTFINPIITKKSGCIISPETCASMPGKEILIARPAEITAVYYTDEFKYEDNKFIGAAAKLFDQQCQLLDGIAPDEAGLVSDIEQDGSLADLTEEEVAEVQEIYKKYITIKTQKLSESIKDDPETEKVYKQLKFTENVINGRTQIIADEKTSDKLRRKNTQKQANLASLKAFLGGKK